MRCISYVFRLCFCPFRMRGLPSWRMIMTGYCGRILERFSFPFLRNILDSRCARCETCLANCTLLWSVSFMLQGKGQQIKLAAIIPPHRQTALGRQQCLFLVRKDSRKSLCMLHRSGSPLSNLWDNDGRRERHRGPRALGSGGTRRRGRHGSGVWAVADAHLLDLLQVL